MAFRFVFVMSMTIDHLWGQYIIGVAYGWPGGEARVPNRMGVGIYLRLVSSVIRSVTFGGSGLIVSMGSQK